MRFWGVPAHSRRQRTAFWREMRDAEHFEGRTSVAAVVEDAEAAVATLAADPAGVIQAVAEAMAFAKSEDLPLDRLIETLSQGAGSSWYFVHRAPNILRDEFPAGFRVRLHEKDLKICRAMAARHGVQLPLIEMTLVHYRRLIEQGHGDEDISTLFRLKDAMFAAAAKESKRAPDKS